MQTTYSQFFAGFQRSGGFAGWGGGFAHGFDFPAPHSMKGPCVCVCVYRNNVNNLPLCHCLGRGLAKHPQLHAPGGGGGDGDIHGVNQLMSPGELFPYCFCELLP